MDSTKIKRLPSIVRTLNDEIARLRAELEAARVDAERYRWLRQSDLDENFKPYIHAPENDMEFWALKGEYADAAIDAARGGK